MKSINVLKIMTDNKKEQDKSRIDTSVERQRLEKVHRFVDTYVKSKLGVLGLKNVNEIAFVDNKALDLVLMLDDFTLEDVTSDKSLLEKEEIRFLDSTDTKLKASIGNKIANYLIKWYTFNDKVQEFIDTYVVPKLQELNENGVITYNLKAIDNKNKIATKRINDFVRKFVIDSAKASLGFDLFGKLYEEEFILKWNFLFTEDTTSKETFANLLYDYLKENHDKIDYKNLDSIDFSNYTGAKVEVYVKE